MIEMQKRRVDFAGLCRKQRELERRSVLVDGRLFKAVPRARSATDSVRSLQRSFTPFR
jgi:hypothetical protein